MLLLAMFFEWLVLYYHGSHPLPFRSEQVEREGVLRTKLMRERDEVKMAVRHYRFVLLRIRMPDGLILQGEWDRVLMVVHQQKKKTPLCLNIVIFYYLECQMHTKQALCPMNLFLKPYSWTSHQTRQASQPTWRDTVERWDLRLCLHAVGHIASLMNLDQGCWQCWDGILLWHPDGMCWKCASLVWLLMRKSRGLSC